MKIDLFDDNVKNDSGLIPLNPEYLSTKTEQPKEEIPIADNQITEIPKELSEPKIAEIEEVKSEKEEILSEEEKIPDPPSPGKVAEIRKWVTENIRELEFWNEIFQFRKEIIEKELVSLMLKNQNLELNPINTTLMLNRIFKSEYKRILLKDNNFQRNYFRNFRLC